MDEAPTINVHTAAALDAVARVRARLAEFDVARPMDDPLWRPLWEGRFPPPEGPEGAR